jgi:hypothetical protein
MPTRRYDLAEARKLIEYRILAQGDAFTELEWFLAVYRGLPNFATRKVHHLEAAELDTLLNTIKSIIANRQVP